MERRRLQLANSHDGSGGGTSLEFPIYLVEGDNGQVGVDLYNYVVENSIGGDMWSDPFYSFESGEDVYFSAFGITEKISSFTLLENQIRTTLTQFGGSSLTLDYTGNVVVNYV